METILFGNGAKGEVSLAAIKEALDRQTAAILAMLELQRELLQSVQEIQVGDDVIGDATSRYQQKMAVVNGGLE